MIVRVLGSGAGGGFPQWNFNCRNWVSVGCDKPECKALTQSPLAAPAFSDLAVQRKIYIHIDNSNPVLDATSAERRAVEAAGWEIGYDGMEVHL